MNDKNIHISIRNSLVARDGYVLVAADYSQVCLVFFIGFFVRFLIIFSLKCVF